MTKRLVPMPGPWRISPHTDREVWDMDGDLVAEIQLAVNDDCARDTALVIAAAPAMLEFIEELSARGCDELPGEYPEEGEDGHAPCLPCRAKALIAKAEGR